MTTTLLLAADILVLGGPIWLGDSSVENADYR
jgi:hypothetical protein